MCRKKCCRFYLFSMENEFFCFDSFLHKIFLLNEELYFLLKDKKIKLIKKKYTQFYSKIFKAHPFLPKEKKNTDCAVTINLSNKCNLNCLYCYRQKNKNTSLSNKQLNEIMDYVTQVYQPNASQYIFSLCYTSESSLDLMKLKYFDYLIGQNEGYLFSHKNITESKAKLLFESLPIFIKTKYKEIDDFIDVLNKILEKEELWNYFDYSNNAYLVDVLKKTNKLSYSKTIMANRQILNKNFIEFNLETKINYFSMSFMTNATNITKDYINFLKESLFDSIYVSLDGPEKIHNENRIYSNNKGTHKDTIQGIKNLQRNGIKVIASVVITPKNFNLKEIVEYLESLKIEKMIFSLVRGKNENFQFSYEIINKFIENIKIIFKEVYEDFKFGIINRKLKILKDTILFSFLKALYYRKYVFSRCNWGNFLVIDSEGKLYHCDSTIGYEKDYMGHYKDGKSLNKLQKIPNILKSKECKMCYAKFLCGGTCYAEKIMGNKRNENIECYFRKRLINENLHLYALLYKNSLLESFIKELS